MEESLLSFRDVAVNDYKQITKILNQLSPINSLNEEKFIFLLSKLTTNHKIICCEYKDIESDETKIIGMGTLLFEPKIIHDFNIVSHIEDIVVDKKYRNLSVGKHIITHLVKLSKEKKVYKIILNCNSSTSQFYEKCGFHKHGHEMRMDMTETAEGLI
jgi:glucosamine-phosphate N-acetyltransferase